MKLVLKLAIVALLLHAILRAGLASWKQYQFKDAIEEELIFADQRLTDEVLHGRIVEIANKYDVPIESDALEVSRQGYWTRVSAIYSEQVKLVPRFYEPVWRFDASVEVRALR